MKLSFSLCLLACIALTAGCIRTGIEPNPTDPIELETEVGIKQLEINGEQRTYRLHIPTEADSARMLSLLIVLHGIGDDGERVEELTGFSQLSNTEGVVVAYPDGLGGIWPGVFDSGLLGANNDVEFIERLIDELQRQLPINDRQIYAAGFSNGAFFAFELGCDLSDTIAAIGLVAGATTEPVFESCDPNEPVSYIAIHGTDDPVVPFEGGRLPLVGGIVSAESGAEFWAEQAGCNLEPRAELLVSAEKGVRIVYEMCEPGYGVELLAPERSDHAWPDERQGLDATELLWSFFQRHPKP